MIFIPKHKSLTIPAYTYIVYMLLMYIVDYQKVLDVIMHDYFDIIGTIINTLVNLYYLYIIKFIEILTTKGDNISEKTSVVVYRSN